MKWSHSVILLQNVLTALNNVFNMDVGVKEEHCGFIEIFEWLKSKPSAEFIIQALCPMYSPTWLS